MPYPLYAYFDPAYLILRPVIILGFYAQWKIRSTYKKFAQIPAASGLGGARVAALLLQREKLGGVAIEEVGGSLTDHYDPRSRTLRLSAGVARSDSIAAYGVAAHEVGHAVQHRDGYAFLAARNAILPVANLGSQLLIPLLIGGFFFRWGFLINIAIILYGFAVVFQLVTLPVELDASRRALAMLRDTGAVAPEEAAGAKKVLGAAALTYVAATLTAVTWLLYLLLGVRRN
ncbi:MAG TPA: zinc metallopeptidase [bacterium]|nr:zinc metallopeptidase [bacterium]